MITIIYDLETTGFSPLPLMSPYNKIIQISAKCVETNTFFDSFVNPNFLELPHKSVKIHNITHDLVKVAPQIKEVMLAFFDHFDILENKDVQMIAHNNNYFDELVLRKEYPDIPKHIKFRDTLPFIRIQCPGLLSYNLGKLHEHFYGEPFANAHRADADVIALERIYKDHVLPVVCKGEEHWDKKKGIETNFLTSIRYVGPYRAGLFCKENIESVEQLQIYANTKSKKSFDRWLKYTIRVNDITQRMHIVSHAYGIPMYDIRFEEHLFGVQYENCFDDVDYYIKYRYVLKQVPGNPQVYAAGQKRTNQK